MDGIYQAWQTGLLWVCLCALGAMAAWLFLAKVAAPAWDALRRWWSLPCIQRVIVGVCVVGLSYYGATKQGWHVAYDGGIKAGATANVVTNDTVSIHWQRDTSGGVYVPETATVYIDAIEHGSSNVVNIAQTTVGAWGWSGTVENATNYDYTAWAYYIPPEPVHTNGVWTYKTHFDRNGEYALLLRARVEVNGVAIATPAEKRKDAEKRPYDAEVEYLESHGTEFINTGIYPSSDMSFDFTAALASKVTGTSYSPAFFGGRISTSGGNGIPSWWNSENFWFYGWGNSNDTGGRIVMQFVVNRAYTFHIDRYGITIDGVEKSTLRNHTSIGSTHSIYLFNLNNNGTPDTCIAPFRIYNFAIYQNGVLVRDFIPVRVGTVGAMYDKRGLGGMNSDGTARNDGLYFNRGTGDFGYGNDK